MATTDTGDAWTLRIFVLLLFVSVLFVIIASSYYVLENANWSAVEDKTLAIAMKLLYIYTPLLGVCLFVALAWLVVDERKIRKLTQQLEKEKRRGEE
jgi:ABC-type siderophore export system fused ATPase/permease subunit